MDLLDSIKKHYVDLYGSPSREAVFKSALGEVVEVFKWSEKKTNEGVVIYATLGASTAIGCRRKVCEFFVGIEPAVDDICEALAEVGLEGRGDGRVPESGDSVTLSYPLWSGAGQSSFLFTCGDEIIPPISMERIRCEFIQLVPLFPLELAYKTAHGEAKLWSEFEGKVVPYWDSDRDCAL